MSQRFVSVQSFLSLHLFAKCVIWILGQVTVRVRFFSPRRNQLQPRSATVQYNIRLLHRSKTATTSNMKQMKTKYNSRIT